MINYSSKLYYSTILYIRTRWRRVSLSLFFNQEKSINNPAATLEIWWARIWTFAVSVVAAAPTSVPPSLPLLPRPANSDVEIPVAAIADDDDPARSSSSHSASIDALCRASSTNIRSSSPAAHAASFSIAIPFFCFSLPFRCRFRTSLPISSKEEEEEETEAARAALFSSLTRSGWNGCRRRRRCCCPVVCDVVAAQVVVTIATFAAAAGLIDHFGFSSSTVMPIILAFLARPFPPRRLAGGSAVCCRACWPARRSVIATLGN